ncbi:hypothetical protein A2U01_0030460, partial [Trifolium medium]|nr:hypothetical protein [Trifolium medium]
MHRSCRSFFTGSLLRISSSTSSKGSDGDDAMVPVVPLLCSAILT